MAAGLMSAGGFYEFVADGAGPHNSIYRGKYLGTSVTTAQYAAISDGTFADLFIGDYWTIGGVNWRIAAFDYYLNTGDTNCTKHHIVIVPDSSFGTCKMNNDNTAVGGYVGSMLFTTGLNDTRTKIKNTFSGHVLNHRIWLVNAIKSNCPSAGQFYDSEVDIMTERMVYGCPVFSPMNNGSVDWWDGMHNYTVEKSQLPLYVLNPAMITTRYNYWLRDVSYWNAFTGVSEQGYASIVQASRADICIHPFFCLY